MRTRKISSPLLVALPILALGLLGGCSMLNGNVKGNFSCRAPDGTCAPTSRIDDAAVALLVGETPTEARWPEGRCTGGRCGAAGGAVAARPVHAAQRRSGEKVLRIMFPSYIDDLGRLHEASAIHTVVESGDWVPVGDAPSVAAGDAAPVSRAPAGLAGTALAAPPLLLGAAPSTVDPDLPTSEQVAAARGRKAVSVEQIRAQVDAVLEKPKVANPGGAASAAAAPAAAAPPPPTAVSGDTGTATVRTPGLPGAPEED
ncbi:conjugal transfer pilus assembly protein TraV [Hephaestia caeni]|uniref:Conjugal transfer pilus assembly protein TraV n=1 Tax=Hephaestia caeni TaxID=645617 RepID=A0A397PGH6_9SPHN|nr:TraV family lipoprotein [Hephaestia caeni]RIA46277.1 conjugal transfer pilus assembly protein TraV [Hephaestia caeni]